jgi:signal recognition particle receptor subunit beta
MWEILSKGAMGIVILIDNSKPDPLADLAFYMKAFRKTIAQCNDAVVIGVSRTESSVGAQLDFTRTEFDSQIDPLARYNECLATLKLNVPVFEVDGRKRDDVKQLLLALLALLDPAVRQSEVQVS